MRKQILLWVGLACLISIDVMGQNKYNDWATNQLQGMVKKMETKRKVLLNSGYESANWKQAFNADGYITEFGYYNFRYAQSYGKYICDYELTDTPGLYSNFYKLSISIRGNQRIDTGEMTQYDGLKPVSTASPSIEYTFDALGRLSIISDKTEGLFYNNMGDCYMRTFHYKENQKLPYKVDESLFYGGDGWEHTLIIKYESVDPSGNWLKRKVYFADNNKLLMEEARTIEYYPVGTTAATQPVAAAPIANRSPQFIGGNAAMKQFFAQNANPRKPAIASAGYGEIIVEFTVTPNGEIQNAKWKGRVSESLDKEALRMVEMMPKWKPGIIDGVPTEMYVQVGIRFFPQQEFRYIKATY